MENMFYIVGPCTGKKDIPFYFLAISEIDSPRPNDGIILVLFFAYAILFHPISPWRRILFCINRVKIDLCFSIGNNYNTVSAQGTNETNVKRLVPKFPHYAVDSLFPLQAIQ
uniref:Uncharacterized protein n=1 Tax=Glossina palpalis gambiensis TaxID=67801 RepID=A0A1B0B2U1_9MUSC